MSIGCSAVEVTANPYPLTVKWPIDDANHRCPVSFLRVLAEEPWVLCRSDCLGAIVRWLEMCGHPRAVDLLPPIEPEEAAVSAWLAERGGLLAVMRDGARALGLAETGAPTIGAVAHLDFGRGGETAAIWLGRSWGIRTRGGFGSVRAGRAIETIWSV